jgi:protein-disulfide isomerase
MIKKFLIIGSLLGIFAIPTLINEVLADEAFGKKVEDYLMQNPDVLARALDNLQDYFAIEEAKRQRQSLLDNANELYDSGSDFTLGPKNASVTIVEFFDYNCGYCKQVFPSLMKIVEENNDVRLVFKEFPILNENSRIAARYALALDEQLKFLTYHSKLMSSRSSLNPGLLERTLEEIGVDVEAVKARAADAAISETIDRNQALAVALGINGTPAFVINDEIHPGALSEDRLRELVAKARGPKAKTAN